MDRAVRWECGCVGFSFGWHNGVYEHVVLEACEDRGTDDLIFSSRPLLSEKSRVPLDPIERECLYNKLRCVFRDAALLRSLRTTLAETLDR